MNPEDAAAIAAKNEEELERARRAAEEGGKSSTLDNIGETATAMDTLDRAAGLVGDVGGFLWDGACSVGRGIGAACEAVESVIPKLD
ncbi:hypothetical protein VQH23_17740 [Pararoseomonas sp. SCSIO 73927]|uniref:hypothetical protein n=1 Tax=Pararoseomonas sp. SCSIO 73927 TaxID=3114537 RepID=UPI0030D31CB5